MWGNIILEVFFINNFNFGFPLNYNDVLMNLTFWQYWWWFWFMFFFVLYYFLVLRLLRFRFFKFNPKLVTSYRAHGKWGDLIICFIPISWCLNIISNSNLLLRILEWQGNTGLLTIRVRGKQWYWVYKFELKSLLDVYNTSKLIGFQKNFKTNYINLNNTSLYFYFINKRNNYDNLKTYWSQYFYVLNYSYNYLINNVYNFNTLYNNIDNFFLVNNKYQKLISFKSVNSLNHFFTPKKNLISSDFLDNSYTNNYNYILSKKDLLFTLPHKNLFFFSNINFSKKYSFIFNKLYSEFFENFRHVKANNFQKKSFLSFYKNINTNMPPISCKISSNLVTSFNKDNTLLNFLVIKQKRYTPKKISFSAKIYNNNNQLIWLNFQKYFYYKNIHPKILLHCLHKLRNYKSLLNLTLNKRLLRTKRLLVLPAHFNINVITNSFDVVHSWYIPGLGLKLDCVPGRSTHHNIYISHFGFFYGQCAEICGRYHHHMPIRICSLPFEHFLIWWYNYSIPVYIGFNKNRLNYVNTSLRFYTW